MSAALRAASDAFVYDVAMLLHVADLLGEDGMALRCEATGWTSRQTLGHLVANYERYARAFARRLAGEQPFPEPHDAEVANPLIAEAERETPRQSLLERLTHARTEILGRLEQTTPAMERTAFGTGLRPLVDVARVWSRHGSAHAVDFLEAAPGLAEDLLVANWAFYPHEGESPDLDVRRKALLKQLRESAKKERA